jgi:hypothetical protein
MYEWWNGSNMHFTYFLFFVDHLKLNLQYVVQFCRQRPGKYVLFACELLMEGRKKVNILITYTILRRLWKL